MPPSLRGAIRLVTLDAMDTLIRLPKSVGGVYADFAKKHGVECDDTALTEAFIHNFHSLSESLPCYGFGKQGPFHFWHSLIASCFHDINAHSKFSDFDGFAKSLYEHFATTAPWQLIDSEAGEELRRIREKGIEVAVISNFDSRLRSVLEGFKLLPLLDPLLLSGEVGIEKPDRRLFQLAANRFQLHNPDEMLHIGDSLKRDFHGARAFGANALLFAKPSDTPQVPPEMVIHSLAELTERL